MRGAMKSEVHHHAPASGRNVFPAGARQRVWSASYTVDHGGSVNEQKRMVSIAAIDLRARAWRPSNYRSNSGWPDFIRGIEEHGLRVKPELRPAANSSFEFEPVTGLRAILGAAEVGLNAIECTILPVCDDFDAALLAFQRALTDGDPPGIVLERGWAMLHLQAELQKRQLPATGIAIAKATGLSEGYVSECRSIATALPRDEVLRIAAEEGVPEYLAVSLARDCLKPLRKLDAVRKEEVLRIAVRESSKAGRGRATALVKEATGEPLAQTSVTVQENGDGSFAVTVGRKQLKLTAEQASELFASLQLRFAPHRALGEVGLTRVLVSLLRWIHRYVPIGFA